MTTWQSKDNSWKETRRSMKTPRNKRHLWKNSLLPVERNWNRLWENLNTPNRSVEKEKSREQHSKLKLPVRVVSLNRLARRASEISMKSTFISNNWDWWSKSQLNSARNQVWQLALLSLNMERKSLCSRNSSDFSQIDLKLKSVCMVPKKSLKIVKISSLMLMFPLTFEKSIIENP